MKKNSLLLAISKYARKKCMSESNTLSIGKLYFLLLTGLLPFVSNDAKAQSAISKWRLGVDLTQVYIEKTEYNKMSNILITPNVGFHVNPQILVGVGVSIGEVNQESVEKFKSKRLGFLPYARYYLGKHPLKPYVQASYGILYAKSEYTFGRYTFNENYHNSYFAAGLGLSYSFKNNFQVLAGVNYINHDTSTPRVLQNENLSAIVIEPKSPKISGSFGINIGF